LPHAGRQRDDRRRPVADAQARGTVLHGRAGRRRHGKADAPDACHLARGAVRHGGARMTPALPSLELDDRETLALVAWHALIASGDCSPYGGTPASELAFTAADSFLREVEHQRQMA